MKKEMKNEKSKDCFLIVRLDPEIKKQFKLYCIKHDSDQTKTIINYIQTLIQNDQK
jgi:hypothetical protein